MLRLTQPSTNGSPPATTDPLHHAVEELLVELRRNRAEVADEADGAGEVPWPAADDIALTQGEHLVDGPYSLEQLECGWHG